MSILSEDIKLLKSAVMADVPEGGGAMTGAEVVDGQSNNLFPDTSTDDRASGRVNLRKVFGAAQTDNTDTLLGAYFAVMQPPADPLVHVSLFQTPGWADERATAREIIERYVVKGPQLLCRVMDTHYAGSRILQLYQPGERGNFPAAGDAVAVRNPDGQEQYLRILKVTVSTSTFFVTEGSGTVAFDAQVAACELGQPLAFDVLGPPVTRTPPGTDRAAIYATTLASGAEFHACKPLGASGAVGDRSVTVAGGVYTPIVPAAADEQPLIDVAPLLRRASLSRTASAPLTLPARTMALQPGTVLRLPTPAQPGTVVVSSGATLFSDDGSGALTQGALTVGTIDHRAQSITLAAGAPSYPSASVVVTYTPATPAGAATHSDSLLITSANQGLGFVAAFEPAPAPGTFTVSYMAQGRWYDLVDNGAGKLAGVDSSYGAGTVNYATGSVAYTVGALPDVGSRILYAWGDAAEAEAVNPAALPARLSAEFAVDARAESASIALAWTSGGAARSAVCSAAGVISGDATGSRTGAVCVFAPATMPDPGTLTIGYDRRAFSQNSYSGGAGGAYTLTELPATPGSLTLRVPTLPEEGFVQPAEILVYDDGAGALLSRTPGVSGQVGTVNYATGAVQIFETITAAVHERVVTGYPAGSPTRYFETLMPRSSHTVTLMREAAIAVAYATGSTTPVIAQPVTELAWGIDIPVPAGLALAQNALAFVVAGQPYTASAGVLRRGWDVSTGLGSNAGAVTSAGRVSISALPDAGQSNAISWINAAQGRAAGKVGQGVFRVESAPIKVGVLQLQAGPLVGAANEGGTISGGGWTGAVDWQRGIVTWSRTNGIVGGWPGGIGAWDATDPVASDELTYNAVFLQYVPLDGTLLGLDTARLPLDGRVPGYRAGGQVLVHNTLTTTLPNPLTKGTVYDLGRERIAAVTVRTATGARVPGSLYTVDFDAGTLTVPPSADISELAQPFTVHHRVEDRLLITEVDISGRIKTASALTHAYPAGTSYASSLLRKGDLFARAFLYIEQATWTGEWSDALVGAPVPAASFNSTDFPVAVTNRGAITERWAVIFLGTTTVRVVGETTGQILTGVSVAADISPLNPQTGAPYFTIQALGWGGGWGAGNVLRFNTAAAGAPAWVARTVLQGPPSVASDSATILFGADVDAP